jgi:hypothetical protein
MRKNAKTNDGESDSTMVQSIATGKALVFISHDTRDAALAEAFSTLLTNITCGMLKSFRSSDKSGKQGLEYGSEWYPEIMKHLEQASDVVCLLTQNSLGRPWILYEAGVAKGKLGTPVHGLALGVPLSQAATGPFAQFQNCDDDAESIAKLVTQLARRLPNADPQKSIVDSQVAEFSKKVKDLLKSAGAAPTQQTTKKSEDGSAAKLFEEVKVMFQELPERMEHRISRAVDPHLRRRRRDLLIEPRFLDYLVMEHGVPPETVWLMLIGQFRDEFPWMYELGLKVHHALDEGSQGDAERAMREFQHTLHLLMHSPFGEELLVDKRLYVFLREGLLEHFADRIVHLKASQRRSSKKPEN